MVLPNGFSGWKFGLVSILALLLIVGCTLEQIVDTLAPMIKRKAAEAAEEKIWEDLPGIDEDANGQISTYEIWSAIKHLVAEDVEKIVAGNKVDWTHDLQLILVAVLLSVLGPKGATKGMEVLKKKLGAAVPE